MVFWNGKKKEPRDLGSIAATLSEPAVQLFKGDGPGKSHFGGVPNLPGGVAWPERDGTRLGFLARLSLAEIQRSLPIAWLPS